MQHAGGGRSHFSEWEKHEWTEIEEEREQGAALATQNNRPVINSFVEMRMVETGI